MTIKFENYGLLLFLLILTGCTSTPKRDYTFIEIPDQINRDSEKPLSAAEVNYDIQQTIYSLDNAYSGSKFLPKDEFQKLRKGLLLIKAPMIARNLCEQIDLLMDQVSDNHLTAMFNDKPCFEKPHRTKPSVGNNFYKEKNNIPWNARLEKRNGKTALLVSITSFPKSTSPVWNGFIDSVKKLLPKAQFIIIDLRGNGGGDDSKGFDLSTLLAGSPLKEPYAPQWNSFKPETYQLFVNTFEYWARLRKSENKEVPPYILQLKQDFIAKRNASLQGQKPELGSSEEKVREDFNYEKSIKKPIYILIDAGCASSCESTTDFFEFSPLVKTVGENTAGYVHFGNNGNIFLKNSGIKLQMAVSYTSYLDGRFIEKKGITPKIQVPAGQNALEYAWKDYASAESK